MGLSPTSPLLVTALTHSSYAAEHDVESNERLEFLGDAVVDLAIADLIVTRYPQLDEGTGSLVRSRVVNERVAALPGFRDLHPLVPDEAAQGALELEWRLAQILAEVTGLPAVSLQPAAGSQGELTGLLMMHAYFAARGEDELRTKIVIPDIGNASCQCTHPISQSGFSVVFASKGIAPYRLLSGRLPDPASTNQVLASFTLQQDYGVRVGTVIHVPFEAPSEAAA